MKTLMRNLQTVYYANVSGTTAITDSAGFKTGEYTVAYDNAVAFKGNVSASSGNVYESPFGLFADYDKVIVCDNPDLGITDSSVVWVDAPITSTYDYVVRRIARSLNVISIAIKKVDVSA